MTARKTCVLGCCLVGVFSAVAAGAEFRWVPISATGGHTINGNEIVLDGAGQRVFLEIYIGGWDPDLDGDPLLKAFQASIDSSGYTSGLRGTLTPATEPCTLTSECEAAFGTGATCDVPPGDGVLCTPGFIDGNRADYIFVTTADLPAVDRSTLNYRYASAVLMASVPDPGELRYAGSLVLEVPDGAMGTFTLEFKGPPASLLQDANGLLLSPLDMYPALITVACQTNEDCDDNSACTEDSCEPDHTCSNVKTYDDEVYCCNPADGTLTPIDDENDCTVGVCDPADGSVTQEPLPEGTRCGGPLVGDCDAEDTCDGSGTCVIRFAPAGTSCGDPGDTDCDDPDACDGTGVCRANFEPPGTACGDPTDTDCDPADTCNGAGTCLDNIQPAGASCGDPTDSDCDDPDTCDGAGVCLTNEEPAGLPCGNPVGNQCDDPDSCDGAGVCQPNPLPAATPCGNPGSSECDDPDTCDGAGVCAANHLPDATPCTDDGNACRDDVCQSGSCAHPFSPAGTACGDPTTTECDLADTCDGTGTCQPNLQPAGTACGDPTITDCDRADTCDGAGSCQANLETAGTACSDQSDTDCDDPDTCDGDGTCLPNVAPTGLPCGSQVGNQCDEPDTCDGVGVCEPNFVLAGTSCGNPGGSECDNPDTCNGTGVCAANNEPDETPCTDDGNECRDDVCVSGVCSHPVTPAGSPCGDPTDTDCDDPDTCDGTGTCLPNLETLGTACGDPVDTVCTDPDTCNGFGACLANHAPDGTDCDDGSFCNAGATCLNGECGGGTTIDCDDGLPCTDDWCNEELERCDHDLLLGYCLITNVCYLDAESNPENDCQYCDTAVATTDWALMPEGTLCDDGDPCTGTGEPGIGVDECTADGFCVGTVDPNCNDDCVNAVQVFDGSNIGNNEGRGPDDAEASCQPDSNNDVWYYYVAACTGVVVMDTLGSEFLPFNDTVLSVYDACGGNEIACDDDGAFELLSTLAFDALDGETYYIRVAGFEEDAGDIVLNIATLDGCVIDGACHAPGALNPSNECEACIPYYSSTMWSPRAAGSSCGDPGEDECDSPDACNGNGVCEANHKEDFEPCPDDENDCTDDVCGGGLCTHPAKGVGTACGDPTVTECDNADTCDGAGTCMPNYVPAGSACGNPSMSECDNADICDGAGGCTPNHQPDGTLCSDDEIECTSDECATGVCVHPPRAEGTPCGDGANTQCDNPDTCDGTGVCLPRFEPGGVSCGDPTDTDCDDPDSCNGAGACVDNFEPVGTFCGDPTNTDCDNPDTCDGTGACLDNLEIAGFPCGDGTNTQCDNPDTCDGAGICLDNFEPTGAACGDPSTSECDNADICDGSGECDPNHQPDGLACTDEGNECTLEECSFGECIHPPKIAGTPCGDGSNTQCDDPDTCDGTGVCLDNFEASGTICGDPTDTDCDDPDTCDGTGGCVDNLEPVEFACGDPTDNDCDNPDTCDGAGVCLDNFEGVGFPCGDTANTQCDNPDTCDGVGVCLDNFEPQSTPCGDLSDDQCDHPDICDGVGSCDVNFETDGATCDDGDICTGDDACLTGECIGTPIPVAPTVEARGSRYLAVTPLPAGAPSPVALLVTSPDWTCLSKYINADGRLGITPVFQTPDDWGTIVVAGPDIAPTSTYEVVAECGTYVSEPGSDTTWVWGDIVGLFEDGAWTPGDGDVDTMDFTAIVEAFKHLDTAPPLEWTDIYPCTPDGIIDVMDMTYVVDAFKGLPYPCDAPCP